MISLRQAEAYIDHIYNMKSKLPEEVYIKEILKHVEVDAEEGIMRWTDPKCSRVQIGAIVGNMYIKNGYYTTNF